MAQPGSGGYMEETPEEGDSGERLHFQEVCWSFLDYGKDAQRELMRVQNMVAGLDANDRALWNFDVASWTKLFQVRVQVNHQFLQQLPSYEICGAIHTEAQARAIYEMPFSHQVQGRNSSKVRSTLRQFVRDWAAEGKAERDSCYLPAMEALKRIMPPGGPGRKKPRVLCPGSGLGRLPFDLVCQGYKAQQNEFSYHMILGSHMIFNRTDGPESHVVFPFVLDLQNRKTFQDNLRPVRFPDISLQDAMPEGSGNDFSMASGEFVEIYKDQTREWDAVVTCFFIDTAKNIFLYIRTIANMLDTGGAWVNLGPLLFHFAEMDQEMSIELGWDEVKPAICKYFDIVEETRKDCMYTVNPTSMRRTHYKCILFTAVRNATPVSGKSHPVY